MARLPSTTAHLRVLQQSFSEQMVEGEVAAGGFRWEFRWHFDRGELVVEPSLGRALIQDALNALAAQLVERKGNQPVRLEVVAARDSDSLDPIAVTVRAKGLAPS